MKINLEIEFILNENVKITKKHIQLLKQIQMDKSITKAAKSLKISYKNAWDCLDEINKASSEPLFLNTSKKTGSRLSKFGEEIINKYNEFCNFKQKINDDFSLKLSAQNKIKVKIIEIAKNNNHIDVLCQKNDSKIKVNISNSALQNLNLKIFDEVLLIFKINFIELENDGENSFFATIKDIKYENDFVYFTLEYENEILKAISKKEKLSKEYNINEKIKIRIPASKIIISL